MLTKTHLIPSRSLPPLYHMSYKIKPENPVVAVDTDEDKMEIDNIGLSEIWMKTNEEKRHSYITVPLQDQNASSSYPEKKKPPLLVLKQS
jgi:hypothetical protein